MWLFCLYVKFDLFFLYWYCGFVQLVVAEKTQNLRRLEAQRNELNAKGD